MKLLTLTLAAALVMAATGCETPAQKEARGLVKTPYGKWVKKGTPYFGDGKPWAKPDQFAYDPTVFNQAMERNYGAGPQPVIVVGPDSPAITTASTVGGTTVISTMGARDPVAPPIYRRPDYGYYGY